MKRIHRYVPILLAFLVLAVLSACSRTTDGADAITDDELAASPSMAAPAIEPTATPQEDAPESEPLPQDEQLYFTVNEYTVYYRVVPQSEIEQTVGNLAEYVDSDGVDMERNRVLYIQYTGIAENGAEQNIAYTWRNIPWGKLDFSVGGTDYRQPTLLMSSATQVYVTYLFVPIDTEDNATVSVSYQA